MPPQGFERCQPAPDRGPPLMRIVVALGGNALLRRRETPDVGAQRQNVRRAVESLAPLLLEHEVVITHGNGPQIGLLALESEAYEAVRAYPLDVLGAESQGMVGYLLLEGLHEILPRRDFAALITRVQVDETDRAFSRPTKPIGPIYDLEVSERLAEERGWHIARDGAGWRRVVPSPQPIRILEARAISTLLEKGITVICAGGGGVPMIRRGSVVSGIEGVIDKDLTSALLARQLDADLLLLLTDVPAVSTNWGTPEQRSIKRAGLRALAQLNLPEGSMGPKVEAAGTFAATGKRAVIAALESAVAAREGKAGTQVLADATPIVHYENEETHAA